MKTKRYVIEALKAEGIKHVFMVPGGELDPIVFDMVEEGSIQPICSAIRVVLHLWLMVIQEVQINLVSVRLWYSKQSYYAYNNHVVQNKSRCL